jgi:hypothetical protein
MIPQFRRAGWLAGRSVLRPRMTIRASATDSCYAPRCDEIAKGGGMITRFRRDQSKTHRTNHHNFRSPAVGERWRLHRRLNRSNGGVDRPTTALRSNGGVGCKVSALLRLRTIERRRRSASIGRRSQSATKTSHHRDRTDEPIGNQGTRTGRFARVFCWRQLIERTSRSVLRQGRTGEAQRLRVAATDRGGSTADS